MYNEQFYRSDAWRHQKAINKQDYRRGWYIFVGGGMPCDCTSYAMRDGWMASSDADVSMRKLGIRHNTPVALGPQEPPDDPMTFNRRQADGTFRPLSKFFDAHG
jgi:hypothetical protein